MITNVYLKAFKSWINTSNDLKFTYLNLVEDIGGEEATDRLIVELIEDEGILTEVYADHRGNPTVGVGHKVVLQDGLQIGDDIPQTLVWEFLLEDLVAASSSCQVFFYAAESEQMSIGWKSAGPVRLATFTKLAFNLGHGNLMEFTNTRAYARAGNWRKCASELVDSAYAGHPEEGDGGGVGQRAWDYGWQVRSGVWAR